MSLASLTPRQREILEYIRHFLTERGYAPSIPEIGRAFSLSSTATIHKHLRALEERGAIRRRRGRQRFVELVEGTAGRRTVDLPLLGTVAAGQPIEAVVTAERLELPEFLAPKGSSYLLRVRGDSMRDEQIRDGDLVVVEDRATAENGETVVALVRSGEATLKRFYRQGSRVLLKAANPEFETLSFPAKDVRVRGVVRGLLRRY